MEFIFLQCQIAIESRMTRTLVRRQFAKAFKDLLTRNQGRASNPNKAIEISVWDELGVKECSCVAMWRLKIT